LTPVKSSEKDRAVVSPIIKSGSHTAGFKMNSFDQINPAQARKIPNIFRQNKSNFPACPLKTGQFSTDMFNLASAS